MKTGAQDINGKNIRVGDRVEFDYHGSIRTRKRRQVGTVTNMDGYNQIQWAKGSVPLGHPAGLAANVEVINQEA